MNAEMLRMWKTNPTVNPMTGRKIKEGSLVYRTLQTLANSPNTTLKQSSSKDTGSSIWSNLFAETWVHYSIDTEVTITVEPIPQNTAEVFNLSKAKEQMVEKERALKKNALYILINEELGTIQVCLDEEDPETIIFEMTPHKDSQYQFHHDDPKALKKFAKKFIEYLKQLLEINKDSIIVRLEAIPSYRAAEDFGESVLRDLYGQFFVAIGVPHNKIRITEYYYEYEDGELYKKSIPFRAPK